MPGEGAAAAKTWNHVAARPGQVGQAMAVEVAGTGEAVIALVASQGCCGQRLNGCMMPVLVSELVSGFGLLDCSYRVGPLGRGQHSAICIRIRQPPGRRFTVCTATNNSCGESVAAFGVGREGRSRFRAEKKSGWIMDSGIHRFHSEKGCQVKAPFPKHVRGAYAGCIRVT